MKPTKIHEQVADAYTEAVTTPGTCCCGGGNPKGVLAKVAGYDAEELATLPENAVDNSFGCGNPLAFSDVETGQAVLDLGSGAGIDVILAAKRVGSTGRVIGVDMTDAMIERGRANIEAAGLANVDLRKGMIEELPVDGNSVDWVISNCVINLSPDKPRVFAEIARVLKPGGRMRVSDLVVEDLPDAVRENRRLYGSCISGAISEKEYVAGLRAAGLIDVEVRERITYDVEHLRGLVLSEADMGSELEAMVESLAGKVHSAIFVARKPGA